MARPATTVSGLQPYPAYKPSGVEWLGDIPAYWRVATVKRHYAIRLGKMLQTSGHASDDCRVPYLKAKHVQWFEVQTTGIDTMWASPDDIERYGVAAGDLLVCEGGEGGRCGMIRHGTDLPDPCIIQNALHRVRPLSWRSAADASQNDYLLYLMSAIAASGWFDALSDKATIAHFTAEKFGALPVSIPPFTEQATIARYLDHADRCIRRCIHAKEKLVKLLEDRRQALVNEAVTGQIDVRTGRPYPAYKPSGVEGLREVPSHWDVRPAKWHFREVDERSTTGSEELLSVSHLTGVTPRSEKNVTMFKAESNVGYKICRSGDVVINTMWAWMAALGVARQLGIVSPSYAVYRHNCNSLLSGDYGELLLRSASYQAEYKRLSTGIRPSRLRLYPDAFLRIRMVCPPPEEQSDVVVFVQRESANSERAFRLIREEIATLQEYRTRLIADVVTGKLDVREAATELPDGIEQTKPSTELDTPSKVDPGPSGSLGAAAWETET